MPSQNKAEKYLETSSENILEKSMLYGTQSRAPLRRTSSYLHKPLSRSNSSLHSFLPKQCHQRESGESSAVPGQPSSKRWTKKNLMMSKSLTLGTDDHKVQRTRSFRQGNFIQPAKIKNSTESLGEIRRSAIKDDKSVTSLDRLVISSSHNLSARLCLQASQILRDVSGMMQGEVPSNVESLMYLLEDINTASAYGENISVELAGEKNKLELTIKVSDT